MGLVATILLNILAIGFLAGGVWLLGRVAKESPRSEVCMLARMGWWFIVLMVGAIVLVLVVGTVATVSRV